MGVDESLNIEHGMQLFIVLFYFLIVSLVIRLETITYSSELNMSYVGICSVLYYLEDIYKL